MRLSRRAPLELRSVGVLLVAGAALAGVLLAGCGGGPSVPSSAPVTDTVTGTVTASATVPRSPPAAPSARTARPARSATPQASPTAALPVAPGAGSQPQTQLRPRTDSAAFRNAMADLWLAVATGNPRFGLPAFFPEAAYKQVKAIPYPDSDWQYRLWYDFALDVRAAHRLVGRNAQLVQIVVPASYQAWVYPGACDNSVGYWHAPGARVVYREHGEESSFGIASLISWRGVWYVVHLGAVSRTVATGIVDQPAVGPGVPGPPGGC